MFESKAARGFGPVEHRAEQKQEMLDAIDGMRKMYFEMNTNRDPFKNFYGYAIPLAIGGMCVWVCVCVCVGQCCMSTYHTHAFFLCVMFAVIAWILSNIIHISCGGWAEVCRCVCLCRRCRFVARSPHPHAATVRRQSSFPSSTLSSSSSPSSPWLSLARAPLYASEPLSPSCSRTWARPRQSNCSVLFERNPQQGTALYNPEMSSSSSAGAMPGIAAIRAASAALAAAAAASCSSRYRSRLSSALNSC